MRLDNRASSRMSADEDHGAGYSQVCSQTSSGDLGHALGVDQHISHHPVLQVVVEASFIVV
jgi:hypothetical protein